MNASILQTLENLQNSVAQQSLPLPPPQSQLQQPTVLAYPQNEALPTPRPKHVLPQLEYTYEDPTAYPQFRGFITQKLRVDALTYSDTEPD